MKKEYVCIVCPNSCRLTVEEKNGEVIVSGNECKRGIAFGEHEHLSPERMITTTVAVANGPLPRLPVISEGEVPRAKVPECLQALYAMRLSAPVACGDVVVENIAGTGVNIVASRSMPKV